MLIAHGAAMSNPTDAQYILNHTSVVMGSGQDHLPKGFPLKKLYMLLRKNLLIYDSQPIKKIKKWLRRLHYSLPWTPKEPGSRIPG